MSYFPLKEVCAREWVFCPWPKQGKGDKIHTLSSEKCLMICECDNEATYMHFSFVIDWSLYMYLFIDYSVLP